MYSTPMQTKIPLQPRGRNGLKFAMREGSRRKITSPKTPMKTRGAVCPRVRRLDAMAGEADRREAPRPGGPEPRDPPGAEAGSPTDCDPGEVVDAPRLRHRRAHFGV